MDGSWSRTEDYAYDRGCCGSFICRVSSGERLCATGTRALHHSYHLAATAPVAVAYAEACRAGDHHHHHNRRRPRLRVARRLGLWPGGTSFVTDAVLSGALRQRGNVARRSWHRGRWPARRTFQCRMAVARGTENYRPDQHHVELLACRALYVVLGLLEVDDTRRKIER